MTPDPNPAGTAPPQTQTSGSRTWVTFVAIIIGAAGLRLAALFNDLWMDEIWSIKVVQQLASSAEIFTRYLQANNHPLSSLWLYAIAPAETDWIYRLFSWFTGSGSVALIGLIARRQFARSHENDGERQARVAGLLAAILAGSCYFLIVYSSEARGYAPALFLSLLGFHTLHRARGQVRAGPVLLYWACGSAALLAHAASVQALGAAALWSLLEGRGVLPLSRRVARTLAWHAAPAAAAGAYYFAFVRKMNIGGAPELTVRQVLGELAAYTVGIPSATAAWFLLPALGLGAAIFLWQMARRSPADAAFCGVLVIAAPVLGLFATRIGVLFPRYFIFGVAAAILLLAHAGAAAWGTRGVTRIAALAAIALIAIGNGWHTLGLLRHGRGEYRAALRYMAAHSRSPDITICSDHDNRNFMLLDYHATRAAPGRRVLYFRGQDQWDRRPEWLIVHRLDGATPPDRVLFDDRGNEFHLEQRFPHAPLSGWDWYVFRNIKLR